MDNDSNNQASPARSGQATGYATELVQAAMRHADAIANDAKWNDEDCCEMVAATRDGGACESAVVILAAEVRRLRAVLCEIAECPEYIERRFIIERASEAVHSHNNESSVTPHGA